MFLNHFHILSLQISRVLVILLTPEKQTLLYIYIYIYCQGKIGKMQKQAERIS